MRAYRLCPEEYVYLSKAKREKAVIPEICSNLQK
jgi:hypothetical protein